MTDAERQNLLVHLHPEPQWFARVLMLLIRDKVLLKGNQHLKTDCNSETVEVFRIEVARFAIGAERCDEGPICLFELEGGKVLLLWGQWLCDPHVVSSSGVDLGKLWESKAWFKHFEFVRAPLSGIVLSLRGIGSQTVLAEPGSKDIQRLPPQPSTLLDGTLETALRGAGIEDY